MSEQQQLANQFQLYQQQLQLLAAQKETLGLQLVEIEKALKEIEKTKPKEVYKAAGTILIKADSAEVKKELEEKKDFISTKLSSLEKNEAKIKEKLEEIKSKIGASGDAA